MGAERRAPCTDGSLTHFASPRGEKSGPAAVRRLAVLHASFPRRRFAPEGPARVPVPTTQRVAIGSRATDFYYARDDEMSLDQVERISI